VPCVLYLEMSKLIRFLAEFPMLAFYSMVMDHLRNFLLDGTSYFFVNVALVIIHLLLISQGILVKLYHPADNNNNKAFYSQTSWGRLEMKSHKKKKV
jgi:hypothetical protein